MNAKSVDDSGVADRAARLRALHRPGAPLLLYNVWDVATAKAVVRAGAEAVATSSWATAAAQGFKDGEQIPVALVTSLAARIAGAVDVPVTVDFETGYASTLDGVRAHVEALLTTGVVGVNIEDRRPGRDDLLDGETQAARLAAVRGAAEAVGRPLVLNARTDLFFRGQVAPDHAALLPEAVRRAEVYREAGADVLFVPGLSDLDLIAALCERSALPINVMIADGGPTVAALRETRVARISFGPGPLIDAMTAFTASARRALQPAAEPGTL